MCLIIEGKDSDSCSLTDFDYMVLNIDHENYKAFWISTVVFLAFTSFLLVGVSFCVWHYERFGGDPQKRTIFNQLVGALAENNMTVQTMANTALFYRLILGPLSMDLTLTLFMHTSVIGSLAIIFTLDEMMVLRFLSVFLWKQSPPINDDFFGVFFQCLNYGLGFVLSFFSHIGGPPHGNMTFILTGFYHVKEPAVSAVRYVNILNLQIKCLFTLILLVFWVQLS